MPTHLCVRSQNFDGSLAEQEISEFACVGRALLGFFARLNGSFGRIVASKVLHQPLSVVLNEAKKEKKKTIEAKAKQSLSGDGLMMMQWQQVSSAATDSIRVL